jgi:transposase
MDLTDKQWAVVEGLLPVPEVREDGRGRPWRDPRDVLNGVLWVLRTGAPWNDMPARYPPYATCFRRFKMWSNSGALKHVLQVLADDLVRRGKLKLDEAFIDGTHAGAKKGVFLWERLVAEMPPNSWRSQTATVFLYLPPSLRVNVTKYVLLTQPSKSGSRKQSQRGSSATKPTTARSSKKSSPSRTSSSSRRSEPTITNANKMAARCADTNTDGRSNGSSPGS